MQTLITNARLINEGSETEGDLLIRDGRIARIGSSISAPEGAEIIDAEGKYLLPGMIDDQVHFRDPGLTHKGDLQTESKAAVAGGITSVMEMPNTSPPTTTREALAEKYRNAEGRAWANYAFYFGATNRNIDEIRKLQPGEACGTKVFMGASTGDMLVDDETTLDLIFRDCPTLVITHCEHTPSINANLKAAQAKWGDDIPVTEHPRIRGRETCLKSSSFAVDLAKQHGTRLHVLHLTTADEMVLFEPGPIASKQITSEACVHHLWFCDEDYEQRGNLIKCNPAIKAATDRDALLQAIRDDRIDIIATDHAPHTAEEKAGNYMKAPAGLPLVQHALPSLFAHIAEGRLDLHTVVRKVSHNVADHFGVVDRGYLREGYWADLTLVDAGKPWTVSKDNVLYKCGWSPFEGVTFPASIAATWVNGELKYRDGAFAGGPNGVRLGLSR